MNCGRCNKPYLPLSKWKCGDYIDEQSCSHTPLEFAHGKYSGYEQILIMAEMNSQIDVDELFPGRTEARKKGESQWATQQLA